MEIGYVKKRPIVKEMEESYLDYAMSVIISRALPDVRDGLKPVHRRILYAMHNLGLTHGAKYVKSARIVGECMGKYHPHGDMAIYDAMVRMAQDFSLRYPLVDGQGNFGSIDQDPPAHQRYTEARLAKITDEMLLDIGKETIDWVDNYDATRKEPSVLPAKLPQLLLNGCMGIAVGMATNILPHNLGELVDAVVHLIDHPEAAVKDLFRFIKGPDFPTGGEIYDTQGMIQAYSTGRGPIVCRAKAEIVETKAGRYQIIVNEMVYGVNKAGLVTKIAGLVKDKKLAGIRDIRDESDKDGIRVVIELKSDAYPKKLLNQLYKLTDLQKTFHINMLALVNGIQPQVLSLTGILNEYIVHRREVVTRRAKYELKQAKDRAHILEGLCKALDHINAVIETIKRSATKETAHKNLRTKFKLSGKQADAILEMRLQTLAGLERKKIKEELEEKKKLIAQLEDLLRHPKKILGVVKKELYELKKKYADARKTKVRSRPIGQFKDEDLVPQEECVIILTKGGYIKRVNPQTYRTQKRGGRGIVGITPREKDIVAHFLSAATHDDILFFTDRGRVFQAKAYELPEATRTARGQAIVNILQLAPKEYITAMLNVGKGAAANYLVMTTRDGIIKRSKISDFAAVRRNGLIAINLKGDDRLGWARLTSGRNEIMLVTAHGQSIRFKEADVRAMGRSAAGVKGITLKADDKLVGMGVIGVSKRALKVLIITENGFGKKTALSRYKQQKRGGLGIKTAKVTDKTGPIAAGRVLNGDFEELITISQKGQVVKAKLKDIPSLGRATQGVKVMRVKQGDRVASAVCV